MAKYNKLTGDPKKGAVPPGEYNVLEALMGEWEALVGFTVEPSNKQLLAMANAGILTLRDFSLYMSGQKNAMAAVKKMPWAKYGLTKDDYASASSVFGTDYKQLTGQDISADALAAAFSKQGANRQGTLTSEQYTDLLKNDAAIQKQFGWVKYGYDFSQWQQQKLQLHSAYGRDINDAEASTILQYNKSASGPQYGVTARQQQQPAGIGQSVVR